MRIRTEPGCFDPFRVLSASERRRHLEEYQRFLEARNGTMDLANRCLPRREAYFREVEEKPVVWDGEIDDAGFYQYLRGSGAPQTDQRILWLATAAKANLIESYRRISMRPS